MAASKRPSRWQIILCALALAGLVIACGSSSSTGSTSTNSSQNSSSEATSTSGETSSDAEATEAPEVTEAPEPTAAPAAEPGTSRSAPLPLNTPLAFSSWAITVTELLRDDAAAEAIASTNQFNEAATEGTRYLLATVQIQNISSDAEAKHVLTAIDLRATGDRAQLYSPATVVVPQPLEGELFPGASTTGQIAFLVPADEGNLMLRAGEYISFDANAQRYLAVDENASITPDPALAEIPATQDGSSKDQPVAVGSAATSEEWEITVLEAARGEQAAQAISGANQFNDPAPEGEEYVALKVRARYLGDGSPDSSGSIDRTSFKLTGSKGVIYEMPLMVVAPEPGLDAVLYAGGTAEGWVVLSAEAGESGLVAIYEPLFSFGSNATRYLAAE